MSECKIVWRAGDVQTLRPDWTDEQCQAWLDENWRRMKDRCVELGWEVMEALLPPAKRDTRDECPMALDRNEIDCARCGKKGCKSRIGEPPVVVDGLRDPSKCRFYLVPNEADCTRCGEKGCLMRVGCPPDREEAVRQEIDWEEAVRQEEQ